MIAGASCKTLFEDYLISCSTLNRIITQNRNTFYEMCWIKRTDWECIWIKSVFPLICKSRFSKMVLTNIPIFRIVRRSYLANILLQIVSQWISEKFKTLLVLNAVRNSAEISVVAFWIFSTIFSGRNSPSSTMTAQEKKVK